MEEKRSKMDIKYYDIGLKSILQTIPRSGEGPGGGGGGRGKLYPDRDRPQRKPADRSFYPDPRGLWDGRHPSP